MPKYITTGQAKAKQALTDEQERALSSAKALLEVEGLCLRHDLKRGQIMLFHNHWVLHGRDRFLDSLESRRHLVRVWLEPQEVDSANEVTK